MSDTPKSLKIRRSFATIIVPDRHNHRRLLQTLWLPPVTVPLQLRRPVAADHHRSFSNRGRSIAAVSRPPFLFSFANPLLLIVTAKRGSGRTTAIVYAVQCEECFKWRQISAQEEFEEIRSKFIEDPFVCNKKANVSCEDPADLEYDSTRLWVIDKPNIPKTPAGFKRDLVLRGDFSKMDAYYTTPAGKRLRATSGVASFLEANPEYQGLSTSDFSFTPPKVMDDTIPDNVERKGPSSLNKGPKTSSNGEDNA